LHLELVGWRGDRVGAGGDQNRRYGRVVGLQLVANAGSHSDPIED
jgi:hypothetical protein